MDTIKVMISSTIEDLEGEREAVEGSFKDISIVEIIGAGKVNKTSTSSSSRVYTTDMARSCDLYILILGDRFGYELDNGKSDTEVEFDAAFKSDPTKILVFKKESNDGTEAKQQLFIDKVCDYYSGYWRTTFKYTHELQELVKNSFLSWLKERACIGYKVDYLDHFIRIAKSKKPVEECTVYYKRTENDIELDYHFFNASHIIVFDKRDIYKSFWKCINDLEKQLETWLEDE